jgi:hypothetical protein
MSCIVNNSSNPFTTGYQAERLRRSANRSKETHYGYPADHLHNCKIPLLLPPGLHLISVLLTANTLHLLQL